MHNGGIQIIMYILYFVDIVVYMYDISLANIMLFFVTFEGSQYLNIVHGKKFVYTYQMNSELFCASRIYIIVFHHLMFFSFGLSSPHLLIYDGRVNLMCTCTCTSDNNDIQYTDQELY